MWRSVLLTSILTLLMAIASGGAAEAQSNGTVNDVFDEGSSDLFEDGLNVHDLFEASRQYEFDRTADGVSTDDLDGEVERFNQSRRGSIGPNIIRSTEVDTAGSTTSTDGTTTEPPEGDNVEVVQ